MKKYTHILVGFLAILILGGCAGSKLSESEKQSIDTISIQSVATNDGAFHEIDASTGNPGIQDSVGSQGGLIGSLVGALIDAGVKSYQNSEFKEKYPVHHETVNSIIVKDIDKSIEQHVLDMMKKDPFFAPRLVEKSSNYIDGEVISFGLNRFRMIEEETYFGARIHLKIWLMGKDGEKLFDEYMTISSRSSYRVTKLAENEKLLHILYDQALADFDNKFSLLLDSKLGRRE